MKNDDKIINLDKKDFKIENNFEEVPYLNNNSDKIQDIIKAIEKNTENIQDKILSEKEKNITYVNFKKNE